MTAEKKILRVNLAKIQVDINDAVTFSKLEYVAEQINSVVRECHIQNYKVEVNAWGLTQ